MSALPKPIPYWGRAYRILIKTKSAGTIELANSAWEPEALKISFEAEQKLSVSGATGYWFAEVNVWNLNPTTQGLIIAQGDSISISAGYQADFANNGSQNVVWSGRVFQAIFERENVVDFKLNIRCFVGLLEDQQGSINVNLAAGWTTANAVQAVAQAANINIEAIDSTTLNTVKATRASNFTGLASEFFARVARDNKLSYWIGPNGVNLLPLASDQNSVPDLVYGPSQPPKVTVHPALGKTPFKPTLIGTPALTQEGATWRVLMDSGIQLRMLVKLDLSSVRLPSLMPGQFPGAGVLNQDRLFNVVAIRHVGGNRENAWYTELTGVTPGWIIERFLNSAVNGTQQ